MHRDMELECQRVDALSWANVLSERDHQACVVEGLESDDNLLMDHGDGGGDRIQAAAMQGFSLMMMAAEGGHPASSPLHGYPMILMGQPEDDDPPLRTPSTVLSLQTTPAAAFSAATTAAAAAAEEEEEGGTMNEESYGKGGGKKRGRQKGPGKPKSHYVKERESSFQLVLKLPLKSRKLFCVAEFYKYMAQSSSDSLCKVTEAYAKAGESVGVSGKTARKWVEDWERRADGTFSESQQGKHVKVEWLLQPEHLQNKARAWIEQNCPKKGDPPRKDSIIKMFRDFCNNDLLADVQTGDLGADYVMNSSSHRKISTETARSWLHRLGFNNFKDFRKSTTKSTAA